MVEPLFKSRTLTEVLSLHLCPLLFFLKEGFLFLRKGNTVIPVSDCCVFFCLAVFKCLSHALISEKPSGV